MLDSRRIIFRRKAAAERAIELQETSAEAHTALGLLLCFSDVIFAQSKKEFKRAIELNPNYATAHHWCGNALLVALGGFDEAISENKRAVELDPLSLIINADLGSTFILARQHERAAEIRIDDERKRSSSTARLFSLIASSKRPSATKRALPYQWCAVA